MAPWQGAIEIPSSAVRRTFILPAPLGVMQRLRLIVPHGARVAVDAVIPHLAQVGIEAPTWGPALSGSCRRHGAVDVCTQDDEACPMPAANWRVRLTHYTGPVGTVRFEPGLG